MSKETKERIEQAIKELDFQPNIVARSLKKKSTSTIGVIVANILHSFSTRIIRAIEDVCSDNGFHVIVCNADDNPEKERNYIEMLQAKQVDGLIVFPTGGNLELYQRMGQGRYPLVFLDRIVEGFSADTIILDNESAAKMAVQHFVDKGYERIAFMTTPFILNITSRYERANGYKAALRANGLPFVDSYVMGVEVGKIKESLDTLLSLQPAPQALLVGNDFTLMEVLEYVKMRQLRIPEDLALISFDEVAFSKFYAPPLTTISQPTAEMGHKAAEVLLQRIRDREKAGEPRIYRFASTLIERDSC